LEIHVYGQVAESQFWTAGKLNSCDLTVNMSLTTVQSIPAYEVLSSLSTLLCSDVARLIMDKFAIIDERVDRLRQYVDFYLRPLPKTTWTAEHIVTWNVDQDVSLEQCDDVTGALVTRLELNCVMRFQRANDMVGCGKRTLVVKQGVMVLVGGKW
jgi:hypothetical protein